MYKAHDAMPKELREAHRMFSKKELLEMTDELEISIPPKINTRQIILAIANDLERSGVPEVDDTTDVLFEFLLNTKYIDDDGELIERTDVRGGNKDVEVVVETTPDDVPECFTFADTRDPACQRCRIFSICQDERLKVRPKCFGVSWANNSEECRGCIEFGPCGEVSKNGGN